jgi:hypothetical protein
MHAYGDHQAVGEAEGGPKYVDMAVSERVERAGIKRGAGHFAGLAASPKPRNAGIRGAACL